MRENKQRLNLARHQITLHYLTLRIGSLYFEAAPICFTKFDGFPRSLIGRGRWLQKVRLGLVTYEEQLYHGLVGE